MISSLRNVGEEVSSSSTELAAIMVQSEANASDQKYQVDLIATAITELESQLRQANIYLNFLKTKENSYSSLKYKLQ